MFCIAYMICAYDVAEQIAIALPLIARNNNIQRNVRKHVCELLFSNMDGICFYFLVCMIFAYAGAVEFAVARLFIAGNHKLQQEKCKGVTSVCFVFRIWTIYVLCCMYELSICV